MSDPTAPVKLPLEERMRESVKRCYNKKIHTNPEFYAAEKKRVATYIRNRYQTDPEFRERLCRQKREQRLKKKEQEKMESLD